MSPIADSSTLPPAPSPDGLAHSESSLFPRKAEETRRGEIARESAIRTRLMSALLWCGLAVLLNLAVWEMAARGFAFTAQPPLSSSVAYDQKFRVASHIHNDHQFILLMGDSLMSRGINPDLLRVLLHKGGIKDINVANLAMDGGTQANSVKYLEFLRIQHHFKPRLIVYDFEVSNTGRPGKNSDVRPENDNTYLYRYLLSQPKDPRRKFLGWIEDTFALARYQSQFKEYLCEFCDQVANTHPFYQHWLRELVSNTWTEFGTYGGAAAYQILDESELPAQRDIARKFLAKGPNSPQYQCNFEFYWLIRAYCRGQHIPLVIVWLPHMTSVYDQYFYKAPYTRTWFLKNFMDYKEQYCFPVNLNQIPENTSFYQDFRHLSSYGATRTTELLAQYLESNQRELLTAK
jgi:hypothetical protein